MLTIRDTSPGELPKLADCQLACFPKSLSTRLGKSYVQKSLQWFLENDHRFLYHVVDDGNVVGYCGGFVSLKHGDGSSSGMLQYAFAQAVKGVLQNPSLLFHAELRKYYPFIWLNLKRKITGKMLPIEKPDTTKPFTPYVGLVVIAVLPSFQGKGIAQLLMKEFEKRVKTMRYSEMVLSVKKDNSKAIKAYHKFGLSIKEEHGHTFVMHKVLQD